MEKIQQDNRALAMLRTALGPMLIYFNDATVVEIYLNSDQYIWVEYLEAGRQRTDLLMQDEDSRRLIELIATFRQTVANKDHPLISAELPFYGYRFEGSLPPVSAHPSFNIRKPAVKVISLEEYVAQQIMTPRQKQIIVDAVKNKQNLLLAGSTGSGKTTAANAILYEISKTSDRILILEDTRELQCTAKDYEAFRTQDNVSMTDLVKTAMRRRPDRIVIGEVRDKSALDLLKAWNTGHPGGLCTIHANNAKDALVRLENLNMEAAPSRQEKLIGEAVDLIIFLTKTTQLVQGRSVVQRKVAELCRCKGFDGSDYILEYLE